MNITETIVKIKSVGKSQTRIMVENSSQPLGRQLIQIYENEQWTTLMVAHNRLAAEKILSEAINRTIIG